MALTSGANLLHAGEPRIERTYMPDAAPSAFAVGFSNGLNFCYDPVRGGLNYVWDGDFVDITSVRPGRGKNLRPVKLLGPVIHRETGPMPLRRGDPLRVPTVEFAGYRVGEDVIEFRYLLDGVLVREEIRPSTAGDGLQRRFRVDGGNSEKLWFVRDAQPPVELTMGRDGVVHHDILVRRVDR